MRGTLKVSWAMNTLLSVPSAVLVGRMLREVPLSYREWVRGTSVVQRERREYLCRTVRQGSISVVQRERGVSLSYSEREEYLCHTVREGSSSVVQWEREEYLCHTVREGSSSVVQWERAVPLSYSNISCTFYCVLSVLFRTSHHW